LACGFEWLSQKHRHFARRNAPCRLYSSHQHRVVRTHGSLRTGACDRSFTPFAIHGHDGRGARGTALCDIAIPPTDTNLSIVALVPHTQVFPYFVELLALQHSNVILLHIPAFFFLLHIDLDSGGARAFSLDPSGASDGAFSVYNSTAYLGQGFKRMFQPLARKYVGSSTTALLLFTDHVVLAKSTSQ